MFAFETLEKAHNPENNLNDVLGMYLNHNQ